MWTKPEDVIEPIMHKGEALSQFHSNLSMLTEARHGWVCSLHLSPKNQVVTRIDWKYHCAFYSPIMASQVSNSILFLSDKRSTPWPIFEYVHHFSSPPSASVNLRIISFAFWDTGFSRELLAATGTTLCDCETYATVRIVRYELVCFVDLSASRMADGMSSWITRFYCSWSLEAVINLRFHQRSFGWLPVAVKGNIISPEKLWCLGSWLLLLDGEIRFWRPWLHSTYYYTPVLLSISLVVHCSQIWKPSTIPGWRRWLRGAGRLAHRHQQWQGAIGQQSAWRSNRGWTQVARRNMKIMLIWY